MAPEANAPEPFTTAEHDIRDLDGFLLNTERLLASELWAISTGDEFKAAMGLWCRAWKQTPAGSLPDDDRVLAAFSGAGKNWWRVKQVALRGFIRCSDGRLYHRVLCDDVVRASQAKSKRRAQTKAAIEARKVNEIKETARRNVGRNNERNVGRNVERNNERNVVPGKEKEKDKIDSTTTIGLNPAREAAAEPGRSSSWNSPDAIRIVEAFNRLRDERWPNDSRLPSPTMTLGTQAAHWLEAGATPDLAIEVMTRVMDAKLRDGAGPPTSLGFCSLSIDGAIKSLHRARTKPSTFQSQAPALSTEPNPTWAAVAFEARATGTDQGRAVGLAIMEATRDGRIAERDRLVAEWINSRQPPPKAATA